MMLIFPKNVEFRGGGCEEDGLELRLPSRGSTNKTKESENAVKGGR